LVVFIAPELMTQDAEGTRGVAEAASDIGGGKALDEIGAESFVLAMERFEGF
jgi:hypothetical protein